MIQSPCLGCEDRELHCHSACEKYIEYAAKVEHARKERQKAQDVTIARIQNIDRVYRKLRRSK